jgi:hypothetical protein
MSFDPEEFGTAIGQLMREQRESFELQIKQLTATVEGMQAKVDKSVSFVGDWQQAMDYRQGALVRRGADLFVAVRAVKAGSPLTAREGSGWESFVKGS